MLNIVLFNPEIPQNTGNIMRTCVALNAKLHLIKPLGFIIDDAKLKRSAVDYYEHINYQVYENWDEFIKVNVGEFYYFTRYSNQVYSKIKYQFNKNTYLIFGSESKGIDPKIIINTQKRNYRIPMSDKIRTLNLSNAVAIVAYDYVAQNDFDGLLSEEPFVYADQDFLERLKEVIK